MEKQEKTVSHVERIQEVESEVGIAYAYFSGKTHIEVIQGEEQETEAVVLLDRDFDKYLCTKKNTELDTTLLMYRLKGKKVKWTPIIKDPKNKSFESAIWEESSREEKAKYRLLWIQHEARKVFKQAKDECESYNPKNDEFRKLTLVN